MTYDPATLTLAEHFLADEHSALPSDADALAQAIQILIEDWLEYQLPARIKARAK